MEPEWYSAAALDGAHFFVIAEANEGCSKRRFDSNKGDFIPPKEAGERGESAAVGFSAAI